MNKIERRLLNKIKDDNEWLHSFVACRGLTRKQIAKVLIVNTSTVDRWLGSGRSFRAMPPMARKLLMYAFDAGEFTTQ